ncbi:unnamed protein product, partial [Laminaria digitata]
CVFRRATSTFCCAGARKGSSVTPRPPARMCTHPGTYACRRARQAVLVQGGEAPPLNRSAETLSFCLFATARCLLNARQCGVDVPFERQAWRYWRFFKVNRTWKDWLVMLLLATAALCLSLSLVFFRVVRVTYSAYEYYYCWALHTARRVWLDE